jgi:hypothetical protein
LAALLFLPFGIRRIALDGRLEAYFSGELRKADSLAFGGGSDFSGRAEP